VVSESLRAGGVGTSLIAAVRELATHHEIDTLKVAVMVGNTSAQSFYVNAGFNPAEEVLYLQL
jgi:ribosomal protein S18 acetylase RimI-like enzyme